MSNGAVAMERRRGLVDEVQSDSRVGTLDEFLGNEEYMYTHVCASLHACTCIQIVCMCVCTCVHLHCGYVMSICIRTRITHAHAHTHLHTRTHTQAQIRAPIRTMMYTKMRMHAFRS